MSVETAIVVMITASGTVSALIGDRIFPNIIPEGESFPAITYHEIWGSDTGYTNSATTLFTVTRLQLTIMNEKGTTGYSDLLAIRDAIITLCRTTRNATHDSVLIDHIESTSMDQPNLDPATTIYGKIISMTIYTKE